MAKIYLCSSCNANFTTRQSRFRHQRNCSSNNNSNLSKSYDCPHCGKSSSRKDNHIRHILKCDSQKKNKEFACPTCNKLFLKKSNMEMHQITHQKVAVNCNQCKRTFLRKDHLEKHMRKCRGLVNPKIKIMKGEPKNKNFASSNLDPDFKNCSLSHLSMAFDPEGNTFEDHSLADYSIAFEPEENAVEDNSLADYFMDLDSSNLSVTDAACKSTESPPPEEPSFTSIRFKKVSLVIYKCMHNSIQGVHLLEKCWKNWKMIYISAIFREKCWIFINFL